MKQRNLLNGGVAVLFAISLAACGGSSDKSAEANLVQKPKVTVEKVFAQDVEQIEVFTATVNSEVKNNISPKSASRIERVYVEVGDYVQKGQNLAMMERVSLDQIRLQMENDSIEFERIDQLYAVGGCSKSEWDAKEMKYKVSRTNYNNLIENTYLLSPIEGVVTARNYDQGDMYTMGSPLFVVEKIRPVKIVVGVSEELYTKINKGMKVDVNLDVYPGETFQGVVKIKYPSVDPATRTFQVEVTIPNSNYKVRPGMFARVTFSYGKESNVVVPDQAIVKQQGSGDRYVYVVDAENKVQFKKVELGRRLDNVYELKGGLASGETVIVTGQSRVVNGQEVEIITKEN